MKNFKFFHGIIETRLTAVWNPEPIEDIQFYHGIDAEAELTALLSEEIARGIDEEIITRISRTINGGHDTEIQRNINYLSHFMGIGGNRA